VRRKDITFEPLYQHPFPARPSAEWNHDDVVQVLLVMLWKDYADGFISLKKLQHLAVGTTTTLADGRRRDQLLGKLMRCAVAVEPKRRGRGPRGLPPSIRYIARDGVLIFADREGWAPSSPRARDAH
jgi:hypothetical protein